MVEHVGGKAGKDRGRVWPIKHDSAIEPHPPAAQVIRRKWARRNVRLTCRYASRPSPVPTLVGPPVEGPGNDIEPETACGEGDSIVGG